MRASTLIEHDKLQRIKTIEECAAFVETLHFPAGLFEIAEALRALAREGDPSCPLQGRMAAFSGTG